MRKLIIPFILLSYLNVLGQSDISQLQITYESKYKMFETDSILSIDLTRLDIGQHSSRYYSLVSEWYKINYDGVFPYKGYVSSSIEVFKNMPSKGVMTFIHMPFWLTVIDSLDNLFQWQLQDGDSLICEYPCKKATVSFRGRSWIIWYTLELPYSDGPWKFCGLPGLVLFAKESEGLFCFECSGIEKGDGHNYTLPSYKKKKVVTPERAEELMTLEYADDEAYINIMTGYGGKIIQRYDTNRNPISFTPKKIVLHERFLKENKK